MNSFDDPLEPSRASDAGLSLVEVLLVLGLIGVLATLAVPTMTGNGAHRVVRQARAVHSALVEARGRAIAERRDYRFAVDGQGRYRLQFWEDDAWTDRGEAVAPAEGITLSVGGAATGSIVFEPHGRTADPGAVEIADGLHTQRVRVLPSGMVRWEP